MKAAVWYGQKDVRVEDREPKAIKDNEVQVKVSWAGTVSYTHLTLPTKA